MYNFIGAFDELNKLYEEADQSVLTEGVKENVKAFTDMLREKAKIAKAKGKKPPKYDIVKEDGVCPTCGSELGKPDANSFRKCASCGNDYYEGKIHITCLSCGGDLDYANDCKCKYCGTTLSEIQKGACKSCGGVVGKDNKCLYCGTIKTATGGTNAKTNEALTEAAEDEEIEIVDDEAAVEEIPAEEPVVEDEPRQVICECDKCGALVIKDEADIVVDEETDLVNVEDECQFCEEAKGFKIVGVMIPYEAAEEVVEEEPIEESLNNSELLKEIEKTNELKTEHESENLTLNEEAEDIIDEDLADIFRKTFDRPASVATQQRWEDELNDDSISDKRRKHLEKKFLQQRDWEERHPDKEVK